MTRKFTRTMFMTNEELQEATIRLYVTEGVKWEDSNEKEIRYTGLKSWSIVDGEDAKEIENYLSENEMDENHEYLVLEFVDGTTSTFRNSHVDMFIR